MDSWFRTSLAFPRAEDTCRARARPSWVLGGIHTVMLKPPNPDFSSRCLKALATLCAQMSQVPWDAVVGQNAAVSREVCAQNRVFLLSSDSFALSEAWIQVLQPGSQRCWKRLDVRPQRSGSGSPVCQPWDGVVVKIHPPIHPGPQEGFGRCWHWHRNREDIYFQEQMQTQGTANWPKSNKI